MNEPLPLPPLPPPPPREVFAIFGFFDGFAEGITEAVKQAWPGNLSQPVEHGWLVAESTSLSAPVYEKLKEAYGGDVGVLVTKFEKYYGWYDKAVWDWIEARQNGRQ